MSSKGLPFFIFITLLFSICLTASNVQKPEYIQLLQKIYSAKDDSTRLAIFERNKDKFNKDSISKLIESADASRVDGKYDLSRSTYLFVIFLSEKLQYPAGKTQGLLGLGKIHFSRSEYDQAIESYKKAAAWSESEQDLMGKALTLRLIAETQTYLGQNAEIIKNYQESLRIEESIQNKPGIAISTFCLGVNYLEQGDQQLGFDYLSKSLKLAEETGEAETIASATNALGIYYDYRGNYDRALNYYKRAEKLNRTRGDFRGLSNNLYNIGELFHAKGNYIEALQYHLESLNIRKKNKHAMAISLEQIGTLYADQGLLDLALQYLNQSYKLLLADNDRAWGSTVLSEIGMVYNLMSQPDKAISYLKKALPENEKFGASYDVAATLHYMGESYVLKKQFDKASECYRKALLALEKSPRIDYKSQIIERTAWVEHALQNYDEAIRLADEAIDLSQKHELNEVLWSALLCKAKNSLPLHNPEQARSALEQSIQVLESLREQVAGSEEDRQRYLERRTEPYAVMIELLTGEKQKEEALNYAERAKARVLLDVMQKGRININQAMSDEEKAEETRLKEDIYLLNSQLHEAADSSELNTLKIKLDKARLDHAAFQTKLYAKHPELKVQRGETEIVNVEKARSFLADEHSALLEYVVSKNKTFLFLLTLSDLEIYEINISEEQLTQKVSSFRNQISKRDPSFQSNSKKLYGLLLAAAGVHLKQIHNLIIIPDSILWDLPFQALLSQNDRFLLEDTAVSYAPSITALNEMEKLRLKRSSNPSILAFANPFLGKETTNKVEMIFRGIQLEPLKEAEIEVKKLRELYGSGRTSIYVGGDAKESVLKEKIAKYNVIHLATHGIVNETNPMYSYLLFSRSANSDPEDGLLEAWEIMNMDLNADLVILSACETARGKIGKGEGMIGLNWAFFIAGCPTTVVSQWKVESSSTADLMFRFHQNLRIENTSRADALRQAALSLLKDPDYRHPFYWASFIVVGDPS